MKLVYLNNGDNSVMEPQVLSLIEFYRRRYKFDDIILLQGFKNDYEKAVLKRKLNGFKSKIVWFKSWPGYAFFQHFALYSISKVLNYITLDDETIIHVRAELYGAIIHRYLLKKKSNAKLLVDLRGVIIEEVDKYGVNNIILKRNKIIFFKNVYRKICETVQITVVSEAFKEYLIKQHGFSEPNICVHPNIAGEQFIYNPNLRQEIRKELGLLEDDLVAICSSNGANAWQKDKELITQLIALDVKVINLSPTSLEIPGLLNKLVPFNSMPGYLAAADIAILWRDNNIVNEVASPSKFSEFAAMGLWVIHNGTVRIALDFIQQNNAGIIVRSIDEITEELLNSFRNYDRIYKSTLGREAFGIENIAKSYIMHYEKILQKEE